MTKEACAPACAALQPFLSQRPALKQAQRVAGEAAVAGGLQGLTGGASMRETFLRMRG